jgi:HD-GYP domain-containing protein (c-di-GMP phosphodiesterase class II)
VENARLYRQQKEQVDFLESLRQIDFAITGSMDLRVTLDVIMSEVMTGLGVDAVNVLLYEEGSFQLVNTARRGFRFPDSFPKTIRLGEGLSGAVIQRREGVFLPDWKESQVRVLREEQLQQEDLQGYYGLPLIAKGKIVGVMELFGKHRFESDSRWMHFAETVATQTAIAVDNAQLFESLQGANRELSLAYDNTLEGWAGALELRDQETEGHSRRVVNLTMEMVKKMNVPKKQWIHIRRGALLHDIGKMGIPDSILQKPGKLNAEEWELMKKHPLFAKRLLESIDYLKPALEIPLYHHEQWDGSGYPYGLEGEEIPLAARIFAVVDVWDALLSDRPYREAWPEEKVLNHIREQAGSHFDPQVVEQFLAIVTGDDELSSGKQGRVQT